MASRVVRVRSTDDGVAAHELREGIAAIQAELTVSPDFPPEVEEAAAKATASPRLPDLDRTDIPFVTIDPDGARDLDQALHLERAGEGYVVHYAIADLAAFITPGDPVDAEANRRGETLYGADSKVPLHPTAISEDAGSLLPDQERPALLWTITLDATGEGTDVTVERARVRSRRQLSYDEVQRQIDDGTADGPLKEMSGLLREVGELRLQREADRGGVSLPLPEQEVDVDGDRWTLEFRSMHPVETWNAQISLLTGMAAAELMMRGRTGLLRTLPPADPRDVRRLRRTARALHVEWPDDMDYPELIRSLDPRQPSHAAMVVACTRLLRGSGYVGFHGDLPAQPRHAALAAEYAHCTAPLRRLVDRYAGEICVALSAGEAVPDWVLDRLEALPEVMRESGRRANQYENAVLDLVEAAVLRSRVGDRFTGVVVEVEEKDTKRGEVTVQDPAVEAAVTGSHPLPLGEEVEVVLATADPVSRKVEFTLG
ncbi:RNB domain-containing ribonuclease [Nocardioides guangzhouensis]|uniref:RNB domain-containing ribonuclease n=1 Tax=Nocardioides guangzhouensis TaxID=2497878 RepID=A0A4V1XZ79_9ACTN|nr:RNB domain-containing ribonuclease [Nocardioides guangzhouensis]RYP85809.1 RNB domain-containing ribonuclease [Nocardioides guangzhouensis]